LPASIGDLTFENAALLGDA